MIVPPPELMERLASALRETIAPAVGDEYTRTQAFMVAVILERLAKEVALAPANAEAERADIADLVEGLQPVLAGAPPEVSTALASASASPEVAGLGPLITALHRWGSEEPAAVEALSLIRPVLRRDIDRRMEIAG